MQNRSFTLLIVWNVLLSGALLWLALRPERTPAATSGPLPGAGDSTAVAVVVPRDTAGLRTGRIAFFFMDTLKGRYDLLKETSDRMARTGRSWDTDLKQRGMALAQKMQAIEEKDQTYTTMAEKDQDRKQYEELARQMQQLQAEQEGKQREFDEMQVKALADITKEITDYLEEYNKATGFDYIFSIQDGGQVWVGNKGLDITADIVAGLNQRHQARKAAAPKK